LLHLLVVGIEPAGKEDLHEPPQLCLAYPERQSSPIIPGAVQSLLAEGLVLLYARETAQVCLLDCSEAFRGWNAGGTRTSERAPLTGDRKPYDLASGGYKINYKATNRCRFASALVR
jgi:hypothetical protein